MSDWYGLWHEVSTAALLGTERRAVPPLPPTGDACVVAVRDAVLDAEVVRPVPVHGDPDPARRVVRLLAAGTIARRAGIRPSAPVEALVLGGRDQRPEIGAHVVGLWHRILSDWPMLDEEFVLRVLAAGRRLAPDLVPPMLHRWRGSAISHARVRAAAGPLAEWLIELSPGLSCRARPPAGADLGSLTPPAITPELALAVVAADGEAPDPRALVRLVVTAAFADRIVVANAVRSLSAGGLQALLDALEPRRGEPVSTGLAPAVRDLAALRLAILRALPPENAPTPPPDRLSPDTEEGTSE